MILIISLLTLVSAQCFTYPESSLFCTPINTEEAQQECSFYSDCFVEQHYTEVECTQVEACQKIPCKSTCQEEFRSRCSAGEVPLNEKEYWCSSGCCQFEYFEGEYCTYQNNRWRCQIESENREVPLFNFELMSESECSALCSPSNVSDNSLISEQPTLSKGSSSTLWWIITLVFIFVGAYLFAGYFFKRKVNEDYSILVPLRKESTLHFKIPFFFGTRKKATSANKHLQKEKQKEKFYLQSGIFPVKVVHKEKRENQVDLLKKIIPGKREVFVVQPKQEEVWGRLKKINPKEKTEKENIVLTLPSSAEKDKVDFEQQEIQNYLKKVVPLSKSTEVPLSYLERLKKISSKK